MLPYKVNDGKRCQGLTGFNSIRRKHSQKPDDMRKMIELVSDREGYNKIELFARPPQNQLFEDESYKGWDVWGNEVESDITI